MKLNFWQMIGVGLLIVGIAVYVYNHASSNPKNATQTTQPAK